MKPIRLLSALALVLLLLAVPVSAQEAVKCSACGKAIVEGKYWRIDQEVFCDACYNALPHCSLCQVPMQRGFSLEGKNICENCLNKLPRCASCGQPMIKYFSRDGELLCANCLEKKSSHCSLCGARLVGTFKIISNRFNGLKKEYCQACLQRYPECFACGELAGEGSGKLKNGRYICADCLRTAVFDPAEARRLYEAVYGYVVYLMGVRLKVFPSLTLVTPEELAALQNYRNKQVGTDQMGLYTSKHVTVIRNEVRTDMTRDPHVYVLLGLPREEMAPVMAHELAHGWSAEGKIRPREPEIEEGFAEWVSYKYLQSLGQTQQMKTMESRTDLYGRGLNRMLNLERQGGIRAVLEYMFRN